MGLITRWQRAGTPVWEGFDIDVCEAEINRDGPTSFEVESQHNIDADDPDALLTSDVLNATRVSSCPDLTQIAVGVDPTGGAGQVGIIAGGRAKVGREWHGFTIADASTPYGTGAADWAIAVLKCYHAVQADCVVVETNFGGDMVKTVIMGAKLVVDGKLLLEGKNVPIIEVTASRGKQVRAQPVAALFQMGRIHHVGHFPQLERQWTSWVPGEGQSPDRLDGEVWIYHHMGLTTASEAPKKQPTAPSRFVGMGEQSRRPARVGGSGNKWKV